MSDLQESIASAAAAIRDADALLITAGAGMGVDSGLPDFRGGEGFWRAYPPLAKRGIRFEEMANPTWFIRDPQLAWGFYGHRLNLYRATQPHEGFHILRRWADAKPHGAFVFTSNVDGHFQKAGFADDRVSECHGSIHHLQCRIPCQTAIWDVPEAKVDIDAATLEARRPLPTCPRCGEVARPNILMFGDSRWRSERAMTQDERMLAWLEEVLDANARLTIVECGAGAVISTVRGFSRTGCHHCRSNPYPHQPARRPWRSLRHDRAFAGFARRTAADRRGNDGGLIYRAKRTQTGAGTWASTPVGVSAPVAASMR